MRTAPRLRLTMAFAAGMAVVLAGLGAFLYLRLGHDLMNGIDMDLRSRAQVILGGVRHSDPSLVRSSHGRLIDPDEAFAQVLSANGTILDASRGVDEAPLVGDTVLRSVTGPTFVTVPRPNDDPARLLVVPGRTGADGGYVVVGGTLGDRNDAMHRLLLELAIAGPMALVLVSFAGWVVAGAILNRLHESLDREQRFLDEASHELRTPLGVLRMELDLALARARTPEELQEALRSASAETDRLVRLAEDLLVLSRTRDGSLPLHRREISVPELLGRIAGAARGRSDGVKVEVECPTELTASIDPDRVRQAVDNLLANSLRHTGPGGRVELSAVRSDGRVQVSVRDTGPGFPADVLHHASQPFARGMAERARNGSGLGLAIVSAVASAHGGRLRLSNPEGGGALATLDIPVR